jgi:hypothetical protein
MLLALNWRGDVAAARAAADAARRLEDPAWPARLLTHGALTEGALLLSQGDWAAARAAYQRAVKFALSISERQALAASVSLVELDIACGNLRAALQLGRPLAMSLRHSGKRETRFELLTLTFSALLLGGEIAGFRRPCVLDKDAGQRVATEYVDAHRPQRATRLIWRQMNASDVVLIVCGAVDGAGAAYDQATSATVPGGGTHTRRSTEAV